MDVLERSLSYDEVTEIFVRVNSLGAKLRSSDLALAQITAKWRDSLRIFQAFQEKCAKEGFYVDLGIHLKSLVAFATGQSRFLTVGNLAVPTLMQAWERSKEGTEFAMNFLRSNVGIDSPALLSSPFLIVSLAYFGHHRKFKLNRNEIKQLRLWALVANAKGRYSRGSSETLLDQDLATVRDGGDVEALIERVRLQMGRLDITPEELEGKNQRSSLFKTMFLAFREAGARDWHSGLVIDLDHSGTQHRLQFHHIFPKAVLKRAGIPQRSIDDIANLAFIGGKTNRRLSDKPPSRYLEGIVEKMGREAFAAQKIPLDAELLETEQFAEFLTKRRSLITRRLNKFLEVGS
jgi:hypothetical protein